MQSIRIIEIPKCKMVSSGTGMFGQEKFDKFMDWFSSLPKTIYPKDFLCEDGEGLCWLYLYDESFVIPKEFDIIDFEGGLYSVATDIDQQTNVGAMDKDVDEFLEKSGFIRDESRPKMGNVITSPIANAVLNYNQMDYYTPIKPRD